MKRWLLGLLMGLMLLPASAQGYQQLTCDGTEYEYNPRVTTILYAGVDSQGPMTTRDRYTIAPRADTINLIVLDGYHQRIRILAISRDIMTEISRYTMDGTYRDTYVSHLGYAYTYGDGGRISCENLVHAVSELLGGISIHEYVITNESGIISGNAMLGGVQVTVPNDDVAHLHPELYKGATVTLTDENVMDYVMYRDVSMPFTNNGRMERQKAFFTSFVRQVKEQVAQTPEQFWKDVESNSAYMQTSITRSDYLSLAEKISAYTFDEDAYDFLMGWDESGEAHDEVYLDSRESMPLILDLFYLER